MILIESPERRRSILNLSCGYDAVVVGIERRRKRTGETAAPGAATAATFRRLCQSETQSQRKQQ
jgi:hypothetical protein